MIRVSEIVNKARIAMNDSVMQQNIDAALAEIKAELAEEKKSNKLLHEAMITAEKRGYDKALAESRAKMPSEDIDVAEMHMNDSVFKQNVNDAIAERMPSEEEINKQAEQAMQRDTKDGRIGIIIDSTYYGVFCDALEWLRSRLTRKTEGGGE